MKPATTDDVLDWIDGGFTSAALGAAMELGLFWRLDEQPLDAAGVARELGIPLRRCRYWLQLLAAAGLVERGPDGYSPSPTARTAVIDAYGPETWALLAEEARLRARGLTDLTLHIRAPGSAWRALGVEPPMHQERMVAEPELARRFTRMLYELHGPLAEALADQVNLDGVARFMDLGGGSGVHSLALLRRHPGATAVVVDIPNVCTVASEIARENGVEQRIAFHPADFLKDALPKGFDLVLEFDVCVYDEALFRRVREALRPGGRFVIADQLAPAEGVGPPARVHWAFLGSMAEPDFTFHSADGLRELLERTGFRLVSRSELPPIEGPARRFSRGMAILEAVRREDA